MAAHDVRPDDALGEYEDHADHEMNFAALIVVIVVLTIFEVGFLWSMHRAGQGRLPW